MLWSTSHKLQHGPVCVVGVICHEDCFKEFLESVCHETLCHCTYTCNGEYLMGVGDPEVPMRLVEVAQEVAEE